MKKISAIFICYLLSISSINANNNTTTTIAPTTTAPTTPRPITTSTEPPKPTPVPAPSEGSWNISGTNGVPCMMARFAAQIAIEYLPKNSNKTNEALIDIPPLAKAIGSCDPKNEYMRLQWDNNSLTFNFAQQDKLYNLAHINVMLDPKLFVNSTIDKPLNLSHTTAHYNTTVGHSYRCLRVQYYNMTTPSVQNITGHLKISSLQFQAFRTDNTTTGFGLAEDCAFDTPDIVPIAVGCVLALLVVIVLAAYLISRRRQSRGYLSM